MFGWARTRSRPRAPTAISISANGAGRIKGRIRRDISNSFWSAAARGSSPARIAVSGDGGGAADYSTKLKSASFAGDTFTAAYDPPGDDQTQINLKGTFNPKGGDGDWSVNAKAQPASPPVATGTWKITKQ